MLRSKKPDLVQQEFYGLLLAHYAVRKLMHETALEEILEERVKSSRERRNQRAVKRKMSSYPLRRDQPLLPPIPDVEGHVKIRN